MKSGVNIKKRYVYFAVGLLILIAGVFVVNAAVDKTGAWHPASQIDYSNIACGDICNDADTQDLSIVGHTISLTRGGSVTVPDNYEANTDTQDLSYNPSTDVISLTNGGSIDITEVNTWRPAISCDWTGWKTSSLGIGCTTCGGYVSVFEAYCSGGIITQMRSIDVCAACWEPSWCPFFYSWNREEYVLETTFIVDKQSEEEKATTYDKIEQLQIFDSPKAVIKEIDPETSYIDMIRIKVTLNNGNIIYLNPVWASRDLNKILEIDGENMITEQGDEVYLEFEELDSKYKKRVSKMEIEANGYYNVYEGWHHDPYTHLIVPE